jgi:hypothetical protein
VSWPVPKTFQPPQKVFEETPYHSEDPVSWPVPKTFQPPQKMFERTPRHSENPVSGRREMTSDAPVVSTRPKPREIQPPRQDSEPRVKCPTPKRPESPGQQPMASRRELSESSSDESPGKPGTTRVVDIFARQEGTEVMRYYVVEFSDGRQKEMTFMEAKKTVPNQLLNYLAHFAKQPDTFLFSRFS